MRARLVRCCYIPPEARRATTQPRKKDAAESSLSVSLDHERARLLDVHFHVRPDPAGRERRGLEGLVSRDVARAGDGLASSRVGKVSKGARKSPRC